MERGSRIPLEEGITVQQMLENPEARLTIFLYIKRNRVSVLQACRDLLLQFVFYGEKWDGSLRTSNGHGITSLVPSED